jgi:hypothetical protein
VTVTVRFIAGWTVQHNPRQGSYDGNWTYAADINPRQQPRRSPHDPVPARHSSSSMPISIDDHHAPLTPWRHA